VRTLIKALKDGDVVWYAPDQSFPQEGRGDGQAVRHPGRHQHRDLAHRRHDRRAGLPYFFERLPTAATAAPSSRR
jgi:hypothetical protein